jgi:tRNA modification GTPase
VFSTADTIVAIATPPGRGGIGVVRLGGPEALAIAGRMIAHPGTLQPRHATLTEVRLKPDTTLPGCPDTTLPGRPDATLPGRRGINRLLGQPDTTLPVGPDDTRLAARSDVTRPAVQPDVTGLAAQSDVTRLAARSDATRTAVQMDQTDDTGGAPIDQVVATFFPAPHSYTGDDVVELSAHGSPVVLRAIVNGAIERGARLAEPGEFTLRAFLNGRIDLMQAEAVADLIDSVTPLQARAAFDQLQGTLTRVIGGIDAALFDLIARLEASVDFPEEGYHFVDPGALAGAVDALRARTTALLAAARRGRIVREGLEVVIVGKPNVGKSSLFNALAGAARAIVTDVPGTTRDLVSEVIDLDGLRVTLVDTAGLRATRDAVEAEGVNRSRQALRVADLIVVVVDQSEPLDAEDAAVIEDTMNRRTLVVANKADKAPAWGVASLDYARLPVAVVSAETGDGLDQMRLSVAAALNMGPEQDRPEITNVRHIALVRRADDALARARSAVLDNGPAMPEEFVLADLQDARAALEEVTGRRVTEDLLTHIFSKFCIGK